ncbi:3068_t:CDS:2, partial [Acaulospora morrowiae]
MSLKTMNGLQSEGPNKKYSKTKKVKRQTTLKKFGLYLVNHQIEFPMIILAILAFAYLVKIPGSEKFFFLHRKIPFTGLYTKSIDDAYFVAFWVVLFTLLRAIIMEYILTPLAKIGGIKDMNQRT